MLFRSICCRALIDDERDAGGITIGQPKIGKVGSPVTGNGIGDVPNIPRGAVKGERRCARDRVGVGLKIFNRSRHRHGIRHRERRDACVGSRQAGVGDGTDRQSRCVDAGRTRRVDNVAV